VSYHSGFVANNVKKTGKSIVGVNRGGRGLGGGWSAGILSVEEAA
jgi:hypothetical protein